jgi:hypothetical protein
MSTTKVVAGCVLFQRGLGYVAVKKEKLPPEVLEFFRKSGAKGGKKGGKTRMAGLTPDERSALARSAAEKRWGKRKGKSG